MTNLIEFAAWLEEQLDARGWRPADLARATGIDTGAISRLLTCQRGLGPDRYLSIARALNIPPETVFRRAGLLPNAPEGEARYFQELRDLIANLNPEEREELLAYAHFRYQRAREHTPGPAVKGAVDLAAPKC